MQTEGLIALEFAPLEDGKNSVDLTFADFKKLIDEGDYIQATGVLEPSQSGEPSLFVTEYIILTKALRPIPDELTDIEQLHRQRYLDMRINPELRELFRKKSKFWSATRDFMVQNGFLEMTMPTMEHTTGGAEATPFVTHHNSLGEDFYLRISSELHQKRMIVGGFEKIFDIDKNFRNEGIDDEHLQEFTQMEFYWAYADYRDLLEYCETLIKHVIKATFGTTRLLYDENTSVDWSKSWPQIPYYEFVEKYAGISLKEYDTIEKLRELAVSLGLQFEDSDGLGRLVDLIYKKTARPNCIEPVWLIDQPVELSPLAKRIPESPELTQRIQLIAYGSELCNGFSELNDPIDQLKRFQEQQDLREDGDDEAMMLDRDYIHSLEVGMPPTAGFAYSERLFSVLSRRPIRECTPFPLLKREEDQKKKQKTQVFHVVLFDDGSVPMWQHLNAIAHLSGSLIAHNKLDKEVIEIPTVQSKDGEEYPMDMRWSIVIKKVNSRDKILQLYRDARMSKLKTTVFAEEFFGAKDDHAAIESFRKKDGDELGWIGVLIYGKKSEVEELTDELSLFE
jgi:lysyl-tRNA synthetase class 2